jgi:hypothetical protein
MANCCIPMQSLNSEQIQELIDVIRAQHLTFSISSIGSSILNDEDKKLLSKYGIKVPTIDVPGKIDEAFKFGMISEALKKDDVETMSYPDFKKFVANGKMLPYTDAENNVIDYLNKNIFSYKEPDYDLKVLFSIKHITQHNEKLIQIF